MNDQDEQNQYDQHERKIRQLYAILHEAGFEKCEIGQLMENFASIIGAWTVGEMSYNQIAVIKQLIQDYKLKIWRARRNLAWDTGKKLPDKELANWWGINDDY